LKPAPRLEGKIIFAPFSPFDELFFCIIREVRNPRSPFLYPLGVRAPLIENHCFRAGIGLLAYLESKVWLKKQKLGKLNSSPTKGHRGHIWLKAITRQLIELESCSNPFFTEGHISSMVALMDAIWWGTRGTCHPHF